MENIGGNRQGDRREPPRENNRRLGSVQFAEPEPQVVDSSSVSGFSYERWKLRALERFNREQQKKVAHRSESIERTNNVAGNPRPGNIRHTRESYVDSEKILVPYQHPAASSAVVRNPRLQSDADTTGSRNRESLVVDKEKRQPPTRSSAVDGGKPPSQFGSETDSVRHPVINLSNWLPGWSAKAKRRQSSQSVPENQEAESRNRNPQTQKPRIEESEPKKRRIDALHIEPMSVSHSNSSSSSSSLAKKLKIVDKREKEGKSGKRSYYREFDDPNKYHKSVIKKEDFTLTKTSQINSNSEIITIKHKKKKTSSLGDSEAPASESHKCGICGKSFGSHQALGGHMSRHNKLMKNTPKPVNELKEGGSSGGGIGSGGNGGSKLVQDEKAHQCKICKKNFPTGQALGGHQRCHWISPVENPREINLALLPTNAMGGGRQVLNLDLNLAPPVVDDGDDGGSDDHSADGVASSSYNSKY